MDESGFSLNDLLTRCWMKTNEQKRLPADTQQRRGGVMAGVIDYLSDQVWCQVMEKLEALIAYFEWLLNVVYPTKALHW